MQINLEEEQEEEEEEQILTQALVQTEVSPIQEELQQHQLEDKGELEAWDSIRTTKRQIPTASPATRSTQLFHGSHHPSSKTTTTTVNSKARLVGQVNTQEVLEAIQVVSSLQELTR